MADQQAPALAAAGGQAAGQAAPVVSVDDEDKAGAGGSTTAATRKELEDLAASVAQQAAKTNALLDNIMKQLAAPTSSPLRPTSASASGTLREALSSAADAAKEGPHTLGELFKELSSSSKNAGGVGGKLPSQPLLGDAAGLGSLPPAVRSTDLSTYDITKPFSIDIFSLPMAGDSSSISSGAYYDPALSALHASAGAIITVKGGNISAPLSSVTMLLFLHGLLNTTHACGAEHFNMPLHNGPGGVTFRTPHAWRGSCDPSIATAITASFRDIVTHPAFISACGKLGGDATTITRAHELLNVWLSITFQAACATRIMESPKAAADYLFLTLARFAITGTMTAGIVIGGRATVSSAILRASASAAAFYPIILAEHPTKSQAGGGIKITNISSPGSAKKSHEPKGDGKSWAETNPDKAIPEGCCAFHGDFVNSKIRKHTTSDCLVLKDPTSMASKRISDLSIRLPAAGQSFNAVNRKRQREDGGGGSSNENEK